jgi:hypothetical protein
LGNKEFTDWAYYWPEGFVHYIEEHNVKPPKEFVDHVMKKEKVEQPEFGNKIRDKLIKYAVRIPIANRLLVPCLRSYKIRYNTNWWKNQKGYTKGKSFETPNDRRRQGRLWLIDTEELSDSQVNFLIKQNFLIHIPPLKIKSEISGKGKVLLLEKCDFYYADRHIDEARTHGLNFEFESYDE